MAGAPAVAGSAGGGGSAGSAGVGTQHHCSPGEKQCVGSTLRVCAEDATTWDETACAKGCSGSLLTCNVCNPEKQASVCMNAQLSFCRSNGTGVDVMPCEYGCDARGSDCARCPALDHICGGECVSNDDPAHCGSSCVPCPEIPHGHAACQASSCSASCDADALACKSGGTVLACAQPRWDFESAADGWRNPGNADIAIDDGTLVVSQERPHSGSSGLRTGLAFGPMRYRLSLEASLCDSARKSGIDVRGKTLQAWVYFAEPSSGVSNNCLLFARDVASDNVGAQNALDVPSNQWFLLRSSPMTEAGAASTTTFRLDCAVDQMSMTNWTGALYLDDVSIE